MLWSLKVNLGIVEFGFLLSGVRGGIFSGFLVGYDDLQNDLKISL